MKTYTPFLLLLGSLLISSCANDTETPTTVTSDEALVRIVNVQSEIVKEEPFNNYLTVVGVVKAAEDVNLASEANGRITSILVKRGSRLVKGATIAKIDDSLIRFELMRAQAQAENAKQNYERRKTIWEQDKIGSEMEYIAAKTTWQQADAAVKLLETQLDRTTLRAPFNAVVEDILMETGETVAMGTPVVRLISDGNVRIRAGVPSRYASSVKVGDKVEIRFDDYQDLVLNSTINFVGNSIEPQARTFFIESLIPNKGQRIKIDMSAAIKIQSRTLDNAIVLNQEYVFRNENGYQVFVVGKDKDGNAVAQAKQVVTGTMFNNRVVILDGLTPGEQVITNGASAVEHLTRINVVEKIAGK